MMNAKTKPVVVITGGNSGIGRGTAQAFAPQGSELAIIGRNRESLAATAHALGHEAIWYQADVSKRDEISVVVEKIVKRFSQVDVLVNAAGFMRTVTTTTPLAEAENLWDEVLDANLKGQPKELVQHIVSQIHVGRAGETSNIAEAVLFLASPEASFITGEILNINGGWLFGR